MKKSFWFLNTLLMTFIWLKQVKMVKKIQLLNNMQQKADSPTNLNETNDPEAIFRKHCPELEFH